MSSMSTSESVPVGGPQNNLNNNSGTFNNSANSGTYFQPISTSESSQPENASVVAPHTNGSMSMLGMYLCAVRVCLLYITVTTVSLRWIRAMLSFLFKCKNCLLYYVGGSNYVEQPQFQQGNYLTEMEGNGVFQNQFVTNNGMFIPGNYSHGTVTLLMSVVNLCLFV